MTVLEEALLASDDNAVRRAIRDEAKRLIIDCTYTGRGHQIAGQYWAGFNAWLGLPSAAASALIATGGGQRHSRPRPSSHCWPSAAFSGADLGARFFHPDKLAEDHGLKGDRFISLRNDARLFLQVDLPATESIKGYARRFTSYVADTTPSMRPHLGG